MNIRVRLTVRSSFCLNSWSSTQEQVYPTSSRMRKFFTSDEYLRQVEKARNFYAGKFMIDFEDLRVQAEIRTAMGWGSLQPTANA